MQTTTFRRNNLFHYTTVIVKKKSRFRLSIVWCFRSRKHEFSWLKGPISSWKGRTSSPCRFLAWWDASTREITPSISSVFPNNYSVPFYTPGWKEVLWEWSVLLRNTTQYPVRSRTQTSRNEIQRTAYWAIASVGRLKKWSFQVKLSNQRDLFFIFNQFVSSPLSFLVLNLLG